MKLSPSVAWEDFGEKLEEHLRLKKGGGRATKEKNLQMREERVLSLQNPRDAQLTKDSIFQKEQHTDNTSQIILDRGHDLA